MGYVGASSVHETIGEEQLATRVGNRDVVTMCGVNVDNTPMNNHSYVMELPPKSVAVQVGCLVDELKLRYSCADERDAQEW